MAREHVERESERRRADEGAGGADAATPTLEHAGNQTATAVLDTYEIGRADDAAELQADVLAASALAGVPGTAGLVPGAAGVIRRSAEGPDRLGGSAVDDDTAAQISEARGGGSPLPGDVRGPFEKGLGSGLGGVRVHTDARADTLARKVDAVAFTTGQDVFFRQGTYAPATDVGRQVLAHEVAHTVQSGAEPVLRRLMSAKQFRESTYTGGHMRGEAIKAIDKHLAEFEKLNAAFALIGAGSKTAPKAKAKGKNPTPPATDDEKKIANIQRRILLVDEMRYMASKWIEDHTAEQTITVPGAAPSTAPTTGTPPTGSAPTAPPSTPPTTPGPTKQTKTFTDQKRKQRMEGVKVFLEGGTYNHPGNKGNKDWGSKSMPPITAEVASLESTLDRIDPSAATTAPGSGPSKAMQKIKQKYEGDAKSMFTKLAPVVNLAVPNEGDSVEVDLKAKVPCDPNAISYVTFHLILTADHDSVVGEVAGSEGKDNIVLRGELLVGAGVGIADMAKIEGELGVYAESSADSAAEALTLFSYGVYRRWRESQAVPEGLVSQLWSGRRGDFGYEKSEAWANEVEANNFKSKPKIDSSGQPVLDANGKPVMEGSDAYVETGVVGRVSGEVGKKFGDVGAKIGASMTFGGGRRYNQESIERVKGEEGAGDRNKDKSGADAVSGGGAQKTLADDTFFFELASEFEVTPLSGGLQLMGKFARPASATFRKAQAQKKAAGQKKAGGEEIDDDTWKAETIELSAELGFTIPAGGSGAEMASKVLRPVATALASLPGTIRTLVAAKKGDLKKDPKSRGAGTALDVAQSALPTLSQYVQDFGDPDNFSAFSTDLTEASGPQVSGGLTIGVSLGFDFIGKEFVVEFSTTQSLEVEIPLFFEGSIEKSKRIIAIKFPGPKVS